MILPEGVEVELKGSYGTLKSSTTFEIAQTNVLISLVASADLSGTRIVANTSVSVFAGKMYV